MNKKISLIKNTLIILMGKICTQMISFFLLPLYTSYLQTSEYGIVDLINTYVLLFVPVISLQLETAIFRYLIDARNDKEEKSKLISTNFFYLVIFALLSLLLFGIINCFFNIKFKWYILGIILANMFNSNFMQVARGIDKVKDYSISSVISGGTTIILNVILIVNFNMGAKGMLLAMLIANIASALYLFFKLKLYDEIRYKKIDNKSMKKMLCYSVPLIPNGISWWIMSASDRTIISIVLNTAANGIYAVSNKFSSIINGFMGVFNLSWSESASINIHENDKNEFFSSVCNDVLKLFGCACLMLIVIMPFVFNIFVKGDYSDAYNYIPILIVSCVFNMLASQYGSIYIAEKETKKIAITSLIAAIINIIIDLLLIRFIKIYAAAISTAISYFVIMIFRYFDIKKFVLIKYERNIILKMTIIFSFALTTYYLNSLFLNIVSFIICIVFSLILNYNILKNGFCTIKNKLIRGE